MDIDPKMDIAFKKIFGIEKNKHLLLDLVNSIVSEKDQISELTIENPYNEREAISDRLSIVDIKAKGKDGELFNVEIQIKDFESYDRRALFYWAKLYSGQLVTKQSYRDLRRTIGIHFLNFTCIPDETKYHSVFGIEEIKNKIKNLDLF